VKSVRFDHLLASTALGLTLALFGQAGMAEQSGNQIKAAAAASDTTSSATSMPKDVNTTPAAEPSNTATVDPAKDGPKKDELKGDEPKKDAAKADAPKQDEPKQDEAKKDELKQDTAAPAADSTKTANAPVAAPPENPISASLRDLITNKKFDRITMRKADREGAEAYYRAHDFKPLWVGDAAADARAKAAVAYLAQVDSVGLEPRDYPTPDLKSAVTPEQQAEAELKFTASILTYARHAQIGPIHFGHVAADISFNLVAPEPAEVLAKLAEAKDVAAALDGYNPPQEGFKALRAKLAELRNAPVAKAEEKNPAPGHEGPARTSGARTTQHFR
jgi:murein L,D-transpeptidase YcbB/YkuD